MVLVLVLQSLWHVAAAFFGVFALQFAAAPSGGLHQERTELQHTSLRYTHPVAARPAPATSQGTRAMCLCLLFTLGLNGYGLLVPLVGSLKIIVDECGVMFELSQCYNCFVWQISTSSLQTFGMLFTYALAMFTHIFTSFLRGVGPLLIPISGYDVNFVT